MFYHVFCYFSLACALFLCDRCLSDVALSNITMAHRWFCRCYRCLQHLPVALEVRHRGETRRDKFKCLSTRVWMGYECFFPIGITISLYFRWMIVRTLIKIFHCAYRRDGFFILFVCSNTRRTHPLYNMQWSEIDSSSYSIREVFFSSLVCSLAEDMKAFSNNSKPRRC